MGNAEKVAGRAIVTYAPAADFFGPEIFVYTVADSVGLTSTAQVSPLIPKASFV